MVKKIEKEVKKEAIKEPIKESIEAPKIRQVVTSSNGELRYILLEDGRLFKSGYQPKIGLIWIEEKVGEAILKSLNA